MPSEHDDTTTVERETSASAAQHATSLDQSHDDVAHASTSNASNTTATLVADDNYLVELGCAPPIPEYLALCSCWLHRSRWFLCSFVHRVCGTQSSVVAPAAAASPSDFALENVESSTPFYAKYLYFLEHDNWVVSPSKGGVALLSVATRAQSEVFRAILRTKKGDIRINALAPSGGDPSAKERARLALACAASLLDDGDSDALAHASLQRLAHDNVKDALLEWDTKFINKNYKFGVLCCHAGQNADENALYANNDVSPAFARFL